MSAEATADAPNGPAKKGGLPVKTIAVGGEPEGVDLSPDGRG